MKRIHSSMVALLFLSVLTPSITHAWAQTLGRHGGISWPGNCYQYSIHAEGSRDLDWPILVDTVRASFASWENVSCSSFSFEETAPATVDRAEFNVDKGNVNLLVWRESTWDEVVDGKLVRRDPAIIALTSVMYDKNTDQILDVDIEFNGVYHSFGVLDGAIGDGNKMDLQSVLTHELGHTLGIDHSSVPGAVMEPYGGPGETHMRTLSQDDMDAICAIYPFEESDDVCETPYCGLDLSGTSTECVGAAQNQNNGDSRGCALVPRRIPLCAMAVLMALWGN
jgi:hypothetical protein